MSQMSRRHEDDTGVEGMVQHVKGYLPTAKRNDRGEVEITTTNLLSAPGGCAGWWLGVWGDELAFALTTEAGLCARYTDSTSGPMVVVRPFTSTEDKE